MKVKNIPKNSLLYARRAIYWNSVSFPFLSGDMFAKGSDVSFFKSNLTHFAKQKREISDAQVIFCPSHKVEDFLAIYGPSVTAKVLILGNSDRDFTQPIYGLPSSIRKVFCQNLMFVDSRYHVLPIGIENLRLAQNGKTDLFRSEYFDKIKQNKILVGPFGLTHSERDELLSVDFDHPLIENYSSRISPSKYAQLSSSFRFVAVPRGNGMDTHRFWETLYRGGIPIVKKSLWSKQIGALGFPIVEIESWDHEVLVQTLGGYPPASFDRTLPILWWPWWEKLIKDLI